MSQQLNLATTQYKVKDLPRFVILEHDYPLRHWDFMLENGDRLRAWKLLDNPEDLLKQSKQGFSIRANTAQNHRLIYLDYEGPVSSNRGFVTQFDKGTFDWVENNNEQVKIHLNGQRLKGIAELTKDNILDDWHLAFIAAGIID